MSVNILDNLDTVLNPHSIFNLEIMFFSCSVFKEVFSKSLCACSFV